jgi:hypothetical protein
MGRGAQEKHLIGLGFGERVNGTGLKVDIETNESRRIYGGSWYYFLADCRAALGVEAGVSIFDIEDNVRTGYERIIGRRPGITFEEMSELLLERWEDNIYYRTISPRHFEAAALKTCQVLFAGKYSGIMKPMVHYIPLEKDFSNFNEVVKMIHDKTLCRELTENAYRDLIVSGRHSYRRFVEEFDVLLLGTGLSIDMPTTTQDTVTALLATGQELRNVRAGLKCLKQRLSSNRNVLIRDAKPLLKRILRRGTPPR